MNECYNARTDPSCTRWDVFLPTGFNYRKPISSLDLIRGGIKTNPQKVSAEAAESVQMGQALRINVPTQGIQYSFEKLYANQSADDAAFTLRYVSASGNQLGLLLSAAGVILVWIGIVAVGSSRIPLPRKAAAGSLIGGVGLLFASIGYLGTTPTIAASLALLIALGLGGWYLLGKLIAWKATRPHAA